MSTIPNELRVLRDQIDVCKAEGNLFVADALNRMLNRQIRCLGIEGEWAKFEAETKQSPNPAKND